MEEIINIKFNELVERMVFLQDGITEMEDLEDDRYKRLTIYLLMKQELEQIYELMDFTQKLTEAIKETS
ncbi:hypothetical protein [Paenibacillus senegalensis]|uniref:hypothetical protein n=1 Tax=Paenibacillus senegalensis TaxID=1465766 RepID=UPI0005A64810|nr:hypothetical protein [Paenibacillus senegalensis]